MNCLSRAAPVLKLRWAKSNCHVWLYERLQHSPSNSLSSPSLQTKSRQINWFTNHVTEPRLQYFGMYCLVVYGRWVQIFWRNQLPLSSSGRHTYLQNYMASHLSSLDTHQRSMSFLTSWTWRWKYYPPKMLVVI